MLVSHTRSDGEHSSKPQAAMRDAAKRPSSSGSRHMSFPVAAPGLGLPLFLFLGLPGMDYLVLRTVWPLRLGALPVRVRIR